VALVALSAAWAGETWPRNADAPEFLQRGAGLYSYLGVSRYNGPIVPRKRKVTPEQLFETWGENPPSIVHDIRPVVAKTEWMGPADWKRIDAALRKRGIVNVVRIEGMNFYEDEDVSETYKRIVSRPGAPPTGVHHSFHCYRHNINWYGKLPETKLGVLVRRDGTNALEYYGHLLHERRTGAPNNPHFMKMRRLYLWPYLTGQYTLDYDKEDLRTHVMRSFGGVFYDNHCHWLDSYDPWSLAHARAAVLRSVGYPSWDPADDPNPAVRRAWREFFVRNALDYYLRHQKWLKEEIPGGPYYCLNNGKAQLPILAPMDLLGLAVGAYDSMKSENYGQNWSFGYKAAIAFSRGRPVQRFGGYDVVEPMANRGIPEWYSPANREKYLYNRFYKRNRELYRFCNPGGSVAVLVLPWTYIRNGQYHLVLDLSWRLDRLGVPYEVATPHGLKDPKQLAADYPVLILPGGQLEDEQVAQLRAYVRAGGVLIHYGDSYAFRPADWKAALAAAPAGAKGPAVAAEDLTNPESQHYRRAWQVLQTRVFADRIGPTTWPSVLPEFGLDPYQGATKQIGDGRVIHDPRQVPTVEQLRAALTAAGAYREHLIDPTGACQVTKSAADGGAAVIYHVVNNAGQPARGVRLQRPVAEGERAVVLCPNFRAEDVKMEADAAGLARVDLGEFDKYALLVVSADAKLLDRLRERERKRIEAVGGPVRVAAKTWKGQRDARPIRVQPPDDAGRAIYLHRQCVPNMRRLFYADIEYPRRAAVGRPATLRMTVRRVGHWSGTVYLEEPMLLFRPVGRGPATAAGFTDFPVPDEQNYPKQDASKLVGKTFAVTWTPARPGRYEVFLQYRWTSLMLDGEANFTDATRYGKTLRHYLKGEPRQKVRYTDRLTPLTIVVEE